ncbi:hypothetical protein K491DRAFT_781839 [Lophiostoma macrostomum CBS 122681]|uniref:Mid2 domain-containing protein n=1 Tax=Lophiostoma macrostomum CBS 122681 TaxID=1314788 RepID=A0A6A6SUU8_9PLEO|nr:hypothetical protein K491DRAFT_781839 [Lophiostoma macrostomum CBS 122681]
MPRSAMYKILFLLSISATQVSAQCYLPDGTLEVDPAFVPCRSDTSNPLSHICCGTNRTLAPGSDDKGGTVAAADECLDNGICRNRFSHDGVEGTLYNRGACTSEDYMNGECLKICTGGDAGGDAGFFSRVTPCDTNNPANSTRWCCGEDRDCCNIDDLQASPVAATFGDAVQTATSTGSTSVSSSTGPSTVTSMTTSTTASSTAVPDATSKPSSSSGGLSTGAKAGIGIGAALGAVALVAFGIWFGKRQRGGQNAYTHELTDHKPHLPVYYAHEGKPPYTHEAAERPSSPRELMGNEPSELPTSHK